MSPEEVVHLPPQAIAPANIIGTADEAVAGGQLKKSLSFTQSLRLYRKAVFWSVALSTAIIMEGFDIILIGNFYAFPAFQRKFGDLQPNGSYELTAAWQTGLLNGSYIGQIFGLWIAGHLADRFGYRRTMLSALSLIAAFIFIPFFAPNIIVLLVGQIAIGVPFVAGLKTEATGEMGNPLYFFPTIVAIVVIALSFYWLTRRHSADSKEDLSSKPKEVPPPTPRRGAGLTQVYPDVEGIHGGDSTEKLTVDIVAIHGLNTQADTTWLAFKNGKDTKSGCVNWLKDRDMLPAKIPYARILTYDWNANISQDVPAGYFHLDAENLLHRLSRNRKDSGRVECPLIFVASCFGGLLLIKVFATPSTPTFPCGPSRIYIHLRVLTTNIGTNRKALLQAANERGPSHNTFGLILDSTIAVAFLGTPFSGTSLESVVAFQARIQNARERGRDELVRYLGQGGELDRLVRDFTDCIGGPRFTFKIVCFWEKYPTANKAHLRGLPESTLKDKLDPKGKALVVEPWSACLKVRGVESIGLEVRHNMLNKFNGPNDDGYEQVSGKLKDYAEEAEKKRSGVLVNKEAWEACLRSLSFSQMTDRLNEIDSALSGTCRWLLENNTYKHWAASDRSILWIRGKPGSGKSTLMKFAFNNAKSLLGVDDPNVVFSFFFHGRGHELQTTPLGFWRSLLFHFLKLVPEALATLAQTYEERTADRGAHGEAWTWHQEELRSFFESALQKILPSHRVLIYVDALDEIGEEHAKNLIEQFKSLLHVDIPGSRRFHICFACRQYPILSQDGLDEINPANGNKKDTLVYIRHELRELETQGQQPTIPDLIADCSNGVFLWARLVVKRVLDLDREGEGLGAIKEAIQSIPSDLDELYRSLLPKMKPDSLKLIQWICFATRPLTVAELPWAMVVDPDGAYKSLRERRGSNKFIADDRVDRRIKVLSCGLAEIVPSSDAPVVQFIHQSVKDFFLENGLSDLDSSSTLSSAHHRLSTICIRYLTMEEIGRSTSHRDNDFPFLRYATTSWVAHAEQCDAGSVLQKDLLALFAWPSNALVEVWVRVYREINPYSKDCPRERTSLVHVVSRHGLIGLLTAILQRANQITVDVNVKDSLGRTPLHWAAYQGHEAVAGLLLEAGAEKEARDKPFGLTPLHWAAHQGHEAVARLLLEAGAEKEAKIKSLEWTPLHSAASEGHKAIAKLLLEAGAEKDARDSNRNTPLHQAANMGHKAVARLLLKAGAEKEARDINGCTPLYWAADIGHEAVARLLLKEGAEMEAKNNNGRTPLHLAAGRGSEAVARLLFEAGAKKEAKDNNGCTPLHLAADMGHEASARLLFEMGAEKEAKNNDGCTPLHLAAVKGHKAVARLLLEAGAEKEARDNYGGTPLHRAAHRGRIPPYWSAAIGPEAVIRLLLEMGAEKEAKDIDGCTPLYRAVHRGHEAIARLLLEAGAEKEAKDSDGWMPLYRAADEGHMDVVSLFQ